MVDMICRNLCYNCFEYVKLSNVQSLSSSIIKSMINDLRRLTPSVS